MINEPVEIRTEYSGTKCHERSAPKMGSLSWILEECRGKMIPKGKMGVRNYQAVFNLPSHASINCDDSGRYDTP